MAYENAGSVRECIFEDAAQDALSRIGESADAGIFRGDSVQCAAADNDWG